MTDLDKYIEKLINSIKVEQEKLDNINRLKSIYTDLKIYEGRWKKKVFCSVVVNSEVDGCDIRYNCGCCGDSPLEVWPYKNTELGKIYSNPAEFTVGERGYYCDVAYDNWEERMRKENISEAVINIVKKYFSDEKEKAREDFEEKLGED